jgi:hypothetical protein
MMAKDFDIYSWGLCYASVCSSLPIEEITERVNRELPTGIKNKWKLHDEPFKTGEANPHPCEANPETHKHYLFSC